MFVDGWWVEGLGGHGRGREGEEGKRGFVGMEDVPSYLSLSMESPL